MHIWASAPQLNYDVFVSGSESKQLEEYLEGIAPSAPYLPRLGASGLQFDAFHNILTNASKLCGPDNH